MRDRARGDGGFRAGDGSRGGAVERRGVRSGGAVIDGRSGWRDGRRGDHRRHGRRYGYGPYVGGVYIYGGGRSWCHRHYRGHRVLRHCHPYRYRWHRHGPWR